MSDELKYCNFKFEDVPDGVKFKRENEKIEIDVEVPTKKRTIIYTTLTMIFGFSGYILLSMKGILFFVGIILMILTIYLGYRAFTYKGALRIGINGHTCKIYKIVNGNKAESRISFNSDEVKDFYPKQVSLGLDR